MIEKMKVFRENGLVVHVGEWDYKDERLISEATADKGAEYEMVLVPHNSNWVETVEDVETLPDGSRIAVSDHVQRRKYPPIADQLDAFFWAMDSGELPKITGFYDVIKAVKDGAPKS